MTVWEYRFVELASFVDASEVKTFNQLGEQGWEFVAIRSSLFDGRFAIFKRPKPSPPADIGPL